MIDEVTFKNISNENLTPTKTRIFAYGTPSPLQVLGQIKYPISFQDTEITALFYVIRAQPSSKGGNLINSDTAQKLQLIKFLCALSSPSKSIADQLCAGNPQLFQGIGKLKGGKVKLEIDTQVKPVAQPHRRIPFHMRKKVEQELKRLEELDIIEKVEGPTPWVSPIVVAPKPKAPDEIRICVDMRLPNEAIKRTRHIMPTLDDILMRVNGANVFSKLDLKCGYHQLELDEESRYITTFFTHVGLRRYERLNFGVTSAAEIFQNTIAETLAGINNCMNISDDILVYGTTQSEHHITLTRLFEK